MSDYLYDPICADTARHFMAEDESEESIAIVANAIQELVESYVTIDGYLEEIYKTKGV